MSNLKTFSRLPRSNLINKLLLLHPPKPVSRKAQDPKGVFKCKKPPNSRKLSEQDVWDIKYLVRLGIPKVKLERYFQLANSTVNKISAGDQYASFIPPFEEVTRGIYLTFNHNAWMRYYLDNKDRLDSILADLK